MSSDESGDEFSVRRMHSNIIPPSKTIRFSIKDKNDSKKNNDQASPIFSLEDNSPDKTFSNTA